VRPISPFVTSLAPWTGAPYADFRVHGLNKMGDPDFLYAAPDMTACAAFSKESRMKFANATKLHRKSGGSPHFSFPVSRWSNPCTRRSANIGHPPRGQGLVGSRKSGGRNDPQTELKLLISLLTRPPNWTSLAPLGINGQEHDADLNDCCEH